LGSLKPPVDEVLQPSQKEHEKTEVRGHSASVGAPRDTVTRLIDASKVLALPVGTFYVLGLLIVNIDLGMESIL